MKLFVWNINQRSSGSEIPEFVSKEILKLNKAEDPQSYPDIVVLTEFLSAANANGEKIKKFKDRLSEKYYTFCNEERDKEREKSNGILIAVKKGFAEINGAPSEDLKTYYKKEDQPNYLQLDIVVDGKPISIIGTRIQVCGGMTRAAYIERRQQLVSLVELIVKLGNKNIIVAGDFNNAYIRGDEAEDYLTVRDNYRGNDSNEPLVTFDTYNYHIMKGIFATAGLTVFTPSGEQYSCGFKLYRDKPSNGYLKEDHIITKNLKVDDTKYCHKFTENYKVNVEWILDKGKYAITPPFPDHAILTADVDIQVIEKRFLMIKEEFELKIAEEFPFMCRGKNADEQLKYDGRIGNLYDAFGCDFADGWYEVIRGLCRDITEGYGKAGLPVDIVVDQVKEKFGTLRFYYHPEGHNPGIHTFDSLSDGQSIRRFSWKE